MGTRASKLRFETTAVNVGLVVAMIAMMLVSTGAVAQAQTGPAERPVVNVVAGEQLLESVNEFRAAHGLGPVPHDPAFTQRVVQFTTQLMHLNPPPPPDPAFLFRCPKVVTGPQSPNQGAATLFHDSQPNISASTPPGTAHWGENIAYRCGSTFDTMTTDMVNDWNASNGHRSTMLNPSWTSAASVVVEWGHHRIAVQRFARVPGAVVPTPTPIPAVLNKPEAPADVPVSLCRGLVVTVHLSRGEVPTEGPDVIAGTSGSDVIDALGGDDVVCGRAGDDVIRGGAGNDELIGAKGHDILMGGAGNDRLIGRNGRDDLFGGQGDDHLRGGAGEDRLSGDGGNDRVLGQSGADVVDGGPGLDRVRGGRGADVHQASESGDVCIGDNDPGDVFVGCSGS